MKQFRVITTVFIRITGTITSILLLMSFYAIITGLIHNQLSTTQALALTNISILSLIAVLLVILARHINIQNTPQKKPSSNNIFLVPPKKTILILLGITAVVSIIANIYFYTHGQLNLSDYDAMARLNIARKMIDSLTPGVGQLGGIWLPFPQVLMMPFIWNNYLWHTGIAGTIVSSLAFIAGAVYVYKTVLLITRNVFASYLVWVLYITNLNILLLQTMAMSESFFIFCLIGTLYYLTQWIKNHLIFDLLLASFFVVLTTLTRYEGYFVFIGCVVTVSIDVAVRYWKKDKKQVEGVILFFLALSSYGILLWCLYSALFYKNPFYWLNLYSNQQGQVASHVIRPANLGAIRQPKSLITAFTTYSEVTILMNGIITSFLAFMGFASLAWTYIRIRKKEYTGIYLPLIIVSLILFVFLVYGYLRGFIPDIEYPKLSLNTILSKASNHVAHSNIRYGIVMAPFIIIFTGIFASKGKLVRTICVIAVTIQLLTNFTTPFFSQFLLPQAWGYSLQDPALWLRKNYDGGYILISANRHENLMFQTLLPYSDFIYEGSRNYWTTSLNNPQKYATWVVFDTKLQGDAVTEFLTSHAIDELQKNYQLVYNRSNVVIYKRKPGIPS